MKNIRTIYFAFVLLTLGVFSSCTSKNEKNALAESIRQNEAVLFGDTLMRINDSLAVKVYDQYLTYVKNYAEDTLSPDYLFKAADLANGLKRPMEAIDHYTALIHQYPNAKKSATAAFMIAFVYETGVQDKEKAKEYYKKFFDAYPSHPLSESARASYEQLVAGWSDEELIRRFEAQNDSLDKIQ